MAVAPWPHLFHLPPHSPSSSSRLFFFFQSPSPPLLRITEASAACSPLHLKASCFNEPDTVSDDDEAGNRDSLKTANGKSVTVPATFSGDSLSFGIREPVYEVEEIKANGTVSIRKINRRQLLKSSGLRPRDIRSVDPSLFLTNSMPSLLVREHAILLNLGTLRAIAMQERVLIFDYNRKGGKAFIEALMPRLNPKNMNGGPPMPFELEVNTLAVLFFFTCNNNIKVLIRK